MGDYCPLSHPPSPCNVSAHLPSGLFLSTFSTSPDSQLALLPQQLPWQTFLRNWTKCGRLPLIHFGLSGNTGLFPQYKCRAVNMFSVCEKEKNVAERDIYPCIIGKIQYKYSTNIKCITSQFITFCFKVQNTNDRKRDKLHIICSSGSRNPEFDV